MKEGSYLKEVKNQYENYPYPARDPATEKNNLYISKSCSLDCLNHFAFGGKRDFSKDFRVLIAGGGTGDDTIYLAEQLRGKPAEIVYVDMSSASMKLAKERAKIRGLNNITWVQESLLELTPEKMGEFDFISCTGVLHHLAEPELGLKALKSVLKPDGSMYIMVYATIGRTGVYQMQSLMREINTNITDIQQGIDNTKTILNALPPGNWFSFNKVSCKQDLASDIGIYDLLLHSQDRAYTVPEMYEFVEQAGLKINKLYNPDHPLGDMAFEPETFINEPKLLEQVKTLPERQQQSICELLFGQIMKQCCFISHEEKKAPTFADKNFIPSISMIQTMGGVDQKLKQIMLSQEPNIPINPMFTFRRRPHTAALFSEMDGNNDIKTIIEKAKAKTSSSASEEEISQEFQALLEVMLKTDMAYLRAPGLDAYLSVPEMIKRVSQ